MMGKYYFDTCTVIDGIDNSSRYHRNVFQAITQIPGLSVFSEYMENELKSVLRHAEKFRERQDFLLREYTRLKIRLKASFISNDSRIQNLHIWCKRLRVAPLKFQDMVHVGICGLENIPNIISDDWHIYGQSRRHGRPFIDVIKDRLSAIQRFSNPEHAFTTRSGSLKMEV